MPNTTLYIGYLAANLGKKNKTTVKYFFLFCKSYNLANIQSNHIFRIFRALSNIYDELFLRKQLKAKSLQLLKKNTPSWMIDRVLNSALLSKQRFQKSKLIFVIVHINMLFVFSIASSLV